MTAPIPEGGTETPLDVDQQLVGEHDSDLPDGSEPRAAAEADQEHNAETSYREPSQ